MKAILKFLDINLRKGTATYMIGLNIVELNYDQVSTLRHAQKNNDCGVRTINKTTWIFNSENWNGFHPDIIKRALNLQY